MSGWTSAPKTRALKQVATEWTSGLYENIQRHRRRGGRVQPYVVYGDKALHEMMLRPTTWRAPSRPPAAFENSREFDVPKNFFPSPRIARDNEYLYRAVSLDEPQIAAMLRRGVHRDMGYMAFSRIIPGKFMADASVIFRLHVDDVARGTPWLWFASRTIAQGMLRNWNRSREPKEREVLLPPGTLFIKSFYRQVDQDGNVIFAINVTYTPDPRFLRKPTRRGAAKNWNAYKLPSLF